MKWLESSKIGHDDPQADGNHVIEQSRKKIPPILKIWREHISMFFFVPNIRLNSGKKKIDFQPRFSNEGALMARTVMTGFSYLLVYTTSSLAEASTPRAIAFNVAWQLKGLDL